MWLNFIKSGVIKYSNRKLVRDILKKTVAELIYASKNI